MRKLVFEEQFHNTLKKNNQLQIKSIKRQKVIT
jgi:hypothetical protein